LKNNVRLTVAEALQVTPLENARSLCFVADLNNIIQAHLDIVGEIWQRAEYRENEQKLGSRLQLAARVLHALLGPVN
jgi:hypothetical protein